jgi:exodeoxyribonuclease V alpha subunit
VTQLADYVGRFSARAEQITRNVDRYEAEWRTENPGREPGPKLRAAWDRRAWAQARPDKVAPLDGADLTRRWNQELADLGYAPPNAPTPLTSVPIAELNRDAVVEVAISRLGAKRSSWNAADIRGEVERLIADVNIVASGPVRRELAEDLTSRALSVCVRLLERDDVPEHVRALTSKRVVDVEEAITAKLIERGDWIGRPGGVRRDGLPRARPDPARRGPGPGRDYGELLVVEGAAGSGKTTTLAAAREMLVVRHGSRMVIVTPTLQAASVAAAQVGTDAHSAGWLIHQHGYRWDDDGFWWRVTSEPEPGRN